MNSKSIYTQLIEHRRLNPLPPEHCCGKYSQVHHIIPKSLGGSDDPENLVRLYHEEHYEAHRLLYEIYPGPEMAAAWKGMSGWGEQRYTAKQHAAAKKAWSEQGHSEETKAKQSESHKKRCEDPEVRAKISEAVKKCWDDPEYRAKMSEANKGKVRSDKTKAKMSKAAKKRCEDPEYRAKLSEAAKNQPKTACPHCNKEFIASHMKRYHGDKCKLNPAKLSEATKNRPKTAPIAIIAARQHETAAR